MKYLDRLKAEANFQKRLPAVLPKLPLLPKSKKHLQNRTAKTALTPFGSFGSTHSRRFQKNDFENYNEVYVRRIDKNTVDFNGQICPVDETGMIEVSFNSSTDKEHASTGERGCSQKEPISCFSCSHYDGKGSAWPGVCRYYETVGQEAKEIDLDDVDVSHGCKCYTARRLTTERR
jgi:hypothetical protein